MVRSPPFLRTIFYYLGQAIAAVMIIMFLSWFTFFFAGFPLVGIVTGHLHIMGKRQGMGLDIAGIWARGISAGLLLFYAFATWSTLRQIKTKQGTRKMKHMLLAFVVAACLVGLVFLGQDS